MTNRSVPHPSMAVRWSTTDVLFNPSLPSADRRDPWLDSLPFNSDSYKDSHPGCYPPNLTGMWSYLECRTGAAYPRQVFFGLQYLMMKYLQGRVVTEDNVMAAEEYSAEHFGRTDVFPTDRWMSIVDGCDGRLPIEIWALPEGTVVPTGTPLMVVKCDYEPFPSLGDHLEPLLEQVWYPTTVATRQRWMRKRMWNLFRQSCGGSRADFETAAAYLHQFGLRGSAGMEAAALADAAHRIAGWTGSDAKLGARLLSEFYAAPLCTNQSIAAGQHTLVMTWEQCGGEVALLKDALNSLPAGGWMSMPIDTYDPRTFMSVVIPACKQEILALHARGGKFILRPDSGDPIAMIMMVLDSLAETFGTTVDGRGWRWLHPSVGVLYGDGMNPQTQLQLYRTLLRASWAAQNVAIGSGGGIVQKNTTRDTLRIAYKGCLSIFDVEGERVERPMQKRVASDPTKASKGGRLIVRQGPDGWPMADVEREGEDASAANLMELVYKDGQIQRCWTFEEVCERAGRGVFEMPMTEADLERADEDGGYADIILTGGE